jgi:2-polyprenyl-6-methoxyphenol hydroxylase-like FAD-dependent oxidoreductase
MTVLIAGAGLAGLSLGLTLHQLGVPFRIFESVNEIKPLGVGINLQPNAVRELCEMGLESELDKIGVRTQELAFFTKSGLPIWAEPRGEPAGYRWPQFSVHRGQLQMVLFNALRKRAGTDCVSPGWRATGYENKADGVTLKLTSTSGNETRVESGKLLIAADGIHSAIRAQMYPGEGEPIWGGAILWRATTQAPAYRTGASMIMAGHDTQRVVAYPISAPDPKTGLATINWIAELTRDPSQGWNKEDWSRRADIAEFLPAFEDWRFDWLDVPALIRGADQVFEYPMVDREPVDRWTDAGVTLIGDAAHPTYPVGSNGGSQAIVDARVLGAQFVKQGVNASALQAFEDEVRPVTSKVTLANRGSGPDAIMQMVEDRCEGTFDSIDDVIEHKVLADHSAKYKAVAGFSIDQLNALAPRIAPDAKAT